MPEAHSILVFMGVFLGLWGLSLIVRGIGGERTGRRRVCRACNAPLPSGSLTCAACGCKARSERAVRSRERSWSLAAGGVGAVAIAAGAFFAGARVYAWTHQDPNFVPRVTLWATAALAVACFAVTLLVWALVGDRSRGRRRCPRCWYDLAGNPSLRCSECGHEAPHAADLYRTRRRRSWAALAVAVLLLSPALWAVPRAYSGGVRAITPTTVLIAGLWRVPDSYIFSSGGSAVTSENWSLQARLDTGLTGSWQNGWLEKRILAGLTHPQSPEQFGRAINLFGIINGWSRRDNNLEPVAAGAVQTIAGWLASPDEKLRSRAAAHPNEIMFLVGSHDCSKAIRLHADVLHKALSDADPQVQCLALYLLSLIKEEQSFVVRTALERVSTASPRERDLYTNTVAISLARFGFGEEQDRVVQALSDSNPVIRSAMITALARVGASGASIIQAVNQHLSDPDVTVAAQAIRVVLLSDSARDARDVVVAILARSNPVERQQLIVQAVGFSGSVGPKELAALLEPETDPANQGILISFLDNAVNSQQDLTPALPILNTLALSPDPTIAKQAQGVLADLKNRPPIPTSSDSSPAPPP